MFDVMLCKCVHMYERMQVVLRKLLLNFVVLVYPICTMTKSLILVTELLSLPITQKSGGNIFRVQAVSINNKLHLNT